MVGGTGSARLPVRTSLDLELDLRAVHTRFSCMQDEISRLQQLKILLEEAKKRGIKDVGLFKQSADQDFHFPTLLLPLVCRSVMSIFNQICSYCHVLLQQLLVVPRRVAMHCFILIHFVVMHCYLL
jgi:hypothetical protein